MARKPENTFRESIHRHLPKGLHHEKMANPYSSGTADDWYSGKEGDLWIEYKYLASVPVRKEVDPVGLLSPLQLRWLNGRYEENRTVAVVIGCPLGGVILVDREWENALTSETFRQQIHDRKTIAEWITTITMGGH